jgi:Uma2 family endonuclease
LSHATEQRDTVVKLQMYENFGVPEYWVVNIKEKNIIAYSNNINGKYMSINAYTTGMEITCLSGLSMKVDDIFDAIK